MLASFWLPDALTLRLMLPEFILVAAVVAVLLAAVLLGRDTRIATAITVLGGLAAAIAAWMTIPLVTAGSIELFAIPASAGSGSPGMMIADPLGQFVRIVVALLLVVTVAIAHWFDRGWREHAAEFLTLLICSAVGMMFMASTTNLLLMIIAIELTSMPSYALAGFDRSRRTSAEAATKYVLFGAATTGIAIFGASLLFGLSGSLHIPTIASSLHLMLEGAHGVASGATVLLAGMALLLALASVLFKISAVPMHFWCPDVFEGAPLSITTWLSTASKAAAVVLLLRVIGSLGAGAATPGAMHDAIIWTGATLSIVTMFLANIAALRQTSVRRLLAYSSIAHAGTMLAAAAIVPTAGARDAAVVSAIAQYIAIYAVMNVGAFVCLGLVARDGDSERLDAFVGLGWRDPLVAASLAVCLFSLVGLPPLGGFVAKFWLIAALAGVGGNAAVHPAHWLLVGAIVANTAISLYYYAAVLQLTYFRQSAEPGTRLLAPTAGKFVVAVAAVMLVLSGTLLIQAQKSHADSLARGVATNDASVSAR